ncbi:DNA internalization-related competence protein ComEC/Rec2 [Thermoanaerobacterium thermosaccharolyticum]|uniref:DNA internalization-related competence protein ComEC/Rec2 n=1 Tax=Thermoanaerobacterium thermosaccharolyticum TaxID=1517 RepID=UPI00177EC89B|nr:DNA internalization-related competence protein ComEC/Rec2 [Thermoanaerobacterium thermosaccharolyticum]MBE0069546.1 DNA internalization-related competence protein ComEC/Rec2 [Thermoanaerobacterium thermosaccharolyticum]MBE0229227.1 DNA internalization-related competence protein ComEC/Rec2 [Thermoanaerobacterium thermosaccharolyticum]
MIIMDKPFLLVAIFLSLGIIICKYLEINIVLLFIILCVILILSIYTYLKRKDSTILLLLSVAIFGMIIGANALHSKGMYDNLNNKLVSFDGIVTDVVAKDGFSKYVLKPKNKEKILITQYGGVFPKDGDLVELRGIIQLPQGKRNPGGFDYKLFLKKNGITALMSVNGYSVKIIKKNADSIIERVFRNTKERIVENYGVSMPKNDADFVSSVILGEYNVEDDILNSFRITGISHIIAVSGFNFGLLTVFMMFVLNIFHIRRYSAPIIIPLLIFYTLITGLPPSAVRSVIMASMALIASSIGRNNNPINAVSFAAVIILSFNPLMLFDIGFQLSFVATLSILLLYNPVKDMLKIKNEKLKEVVSVTVAAQLGTIPITIYSFHNLSIISLLPNIIIVPIVSITVILGFLSALIGLIFSPLAIILNMINTPIVELILFLTKIFAEIPHASINVSVPPFYMIIFYYTALLIMISSLSKINKLKVISLILFISMTVLFVSTLIPRNLEITFLDVGQGDSTFLRTPDGENILIDGGGRPEYNRSSFDVGQDILLPYLLYENAASLDAIFISHTDSDHIGGILSILDDVDVKRIFIGRQVQEDENYKRLMDIANKKKIPVFQLSKGDTITIDGIRYYVLSPSSSIINENPINNNALVFKMVYQNVSILFTGDIEKEAENALIDDNISSDILKVAHHGSNTSSQKNFIDKVNPKISVIMVGKNNYGQPDSEVVKYLESKSQLFRTDKDGAVIVDTNGTYIHIKKMVGD